MKIIVAARAVADIGRIDTWWRANRPDAPDAFLDDLEDAKRTSLSAPNVAPFYARVARGTVRRILLTKSGHHLYFRVESADVLRILGVWDARRGRGPRFR